MGDSGGQVSQSEPVVSAVAIPLSAVPVVTPLDPPSSEELRTRQAIVAAARSAQKRGSNMRGLVHQMAKASQKLVLQQPTTVVIPPEVKARPRRFFEALSKLGDVGKAAAIVGLSSKSGTLQRWRGQHAQTWAESLRVGLEYAEAHQPLEWPEVEGILAQMIRNPLYRDRLKAVELWARLDGRLDPRITVEVSRAGLEAKLQEALTSYGLQTKLISAPSVVADESSEKHRE